MKVQTTVFKHAYNVNKNQWKSYMWILLKVMKNWQTVLAVKIPMGFIFYFSNTKWMPDVYTHVNVIFSLSKILF